MVKSHFTDEIIEIKPLLYFSESIVYHNRQISHYSHSVNEGTEGPMVNLCA